jgi:hypothetical protein
VKRLVVVVEGEGDEAAVPRLLSRTLDLAGEHGWFVDTKRTLKVGGLPAFRKHFDRYARLLRLQPADALLVLLDLEDGCPVREAQSLAADVRALSFPYPVAVVLAHREYEAWFLASLPSIASAVESLPDGAEYEDDPEARRGCKERLTALMPPGRAYKETLDQPAFTSVLDFDLAAERCRSFQRLVHAVDQLTTATGAVVTP